MGTIFLVLLGTTYLNGLGAGEDSLSSDQCRGVYNIGYRAVCRNFAKGGGGGRTCRILKRGGQRSKQCQGEHWKAMWSPTAHKQCSFSCLMRIAIEAPEELSESDLNEIIDVWKRKSRRILFDVRFS